MYAKIVIWASKEKKKQRGEIMEMTIIEALETLASYNENGFETLVKSNASEVMTIVDAIEDVRNFAEDPDEIHDLKVTEDSIRVLDENGYIKSGEALYRVIGE
jgi:DNA-binding protein